MQLQIIFRAAVNHKVFLAQFDVIKNLAQRESCVIVGRCADYALADNPDCFSVFIHSRMDFRVKRVREYNPEKVFKDDNKVMDFINKIDRNVPTIIIIIPTKNGRMPEATICVWTVPFWESIKTVDS